METHIARYHNIFGPQGGKKSARCDLSKGRNVTEREATGNARTPL
jgi:hypothetical protein